ncbi:D-sedoheptulose 7-phosphate isomerase [Nicoletella semolina]|uniref:D-sedoheptulose 7-phosphate isomerase n=1 Tax=Nicoletella semolina TaxID=271160 RepID=A0A4R2NCX7_9PAST|nr:SIS domain-containing protein [Nicoletella semolina]MDH2924176.1 SIS domain-containing protein [Nicoletella semolina]TCP18928.1 D-sedoheptulose 7-phosphate isomerase [Nicoletella semolina]
MLGKIQDIFSQSIQTQIAAAEMLPNGLEKVANRIVTCLLGGNKVIVCGDGRSYANAQLLVGNLLHRYDFERPSLAACLLHFDGLFSSYLAQDEQTARRYCKQLNAVAKEGDLFIVFSPFGNEQAVLNVINSAKDRNLDICAFTSSRNDHTQGLLSEQDLEISMPSINESRIIEGHHFCINLLCELVDHLLFYSN